MSKSQCCQPSRPSNITGDGTGRRLAVRPELGRNGAVFQLQTQGQDGDQETCSDDKREVDGHQVLPTKVRACTHWSLPKTVRPPRRRQMLVVRRDSGPDARAPLPPLQPVERPAESTREGGGKGDGLESGQMPTRAGLWAVFHGRVRPSGDGLPGGYWSREVPAQMNDGMEQAQRLTQARGAAAVGFICVLFFFHFCSFYLSFNFHLSAGMKGSGGGAPPSSRLVRRRRGY